jgi:phosphomannomutase
MVTASHNPPEYNGIKLFSEGMEYTRKQEAEVESAISGKETIADWNRAGQKKEQSYSQEYIHFLLTQVDLPSIVGKKPRVLLDAGNAAASLLAPALLRAAGCEVIELYCSEPGKFVRNLEPKAETLANAAKKVRERKCDLGIAFDGDGDRAIGIDEKGRVLALDAQLAIFCSHFLKKKKGLVISTVEASLCVKETVQALGGKLSITPVGSLHVATEVKKQRAVFGGEPCGEYVFPASTPCADGCLSALFLAEIFCTRGKLSALADGIHAYPMERRKYKCEGKSKEKIMVRLSKSLSFQGAALSPMDGLRFDFPDGWLLVRPSGTEPAIRLTCEFREKKRLDETVSVAEKAIISAIG